MGVKAIENLMKQKGKFDYILLETTGLADPGPIASIFWMDEQLCSDLYLDGKINKWLSNKSKKNTWVCIYLVSCEYSLLNISLKKKDIHCFNYHPKTNMKNLSKLL